MEPTQQKPIEEILSHCNRHNSLDGNETSEKNMVLQHSITTEEIKNLSPALSQHNITQGIEYLSQTLDRENLFLKNNNKERSLPITDECYEVNQSAVKNSLNPKTNTYFHINRNKRQRTSPELSQTSHSALSVAYPQLLHFEYQNLDSQIMTVTGFDYRHGAKDFIKDENTLLHECNTYKIDKNEFSNLIESHNDEIYQNLPCDKTSGKLVEEVQTDKHNKEDTCDTDKCVDNAFRASDNIDANVQTDIEHLNFSEIKVDSSFVPLHRLNMFSFETTSNAKNTAGIPKKNIFNSKTIFIKEVNEKITDCVIPELCVSKLMTKDNVDQIENITESLQQSLTKVSYNQHTYPDKSDKNNTRALQNIETEYLCPKLNQKLFFDNHKCLYDKNDKLIQNEYYEYKFDQAEVKLLRQSINSYLQPSNIDRIQHNQITLSELSEPLYSLPSFVHQNLLNSEPKSSENPSQNITQNSNNKNYDTKEMSYAANQDTIFSNEQNVYKASGHELVLKEENKFFALISENSTNSKTTTDEIGSYEIYSKGATKIQTNISNVPFNLRPNNVSIAQNIDINSTSICLINVAVSGTLKDTGYQRCFTKDSKSEIKPSEMEENHVSCLSSGLRKDQVVPEEEENLEIISDCTFYEKEKDENDFKGNIIIIMVLFTRMRESYICHTTFYHIISVGFH